MRWRLLIEYDGRPFVGWQRQKNGISVQEVIEKAVHCLTGETTEVVGAGRTDAGVHALGQVAHVDIMRPLLPERVQGALNFYLSGSGVAILQASIARPEFHARFDAIARHYRYRILDRLAPATVAHGLVWQVRMPLDADKMREAALVLLGRHDFSSFRGRLCQAKSPVRTLDTLDVTREGMEIHVVARARSFLHHQVRNMVGTLALVGRGKWTTTDVQKALSAANRAAAGPTAPPDGLFLEAVVYGSGDMPAIAANPSR